jgi:hypothetical protein
MKGFDGVGWNVSDGRGKKLDILQCGQIEVLVSKYP